MYIDISALVLGILGLYFIISSVGMPKIINLNTPPPEACENCRRERRATVMGVFGSVLVIVAFLLLLYFNT